MSKWRRVLSASGVVAAVAVLGASQAGGAPGPLGFYTDKAAYEALVGQPTATIDFEDYAPGQQLFFASPPGAGVSFVRSGVTFSDPYAVGFGYVLAGGSNFSVAEGYLEQLTRWDFPQNVPSSWPPAAIVLPSGICGVGLNLFSIGSGQYSIKVGATDTAATIPPTVFAPAVEPGLWFLGVASQHEITQLVLPPNGTAAFILSVELAQCGSGSGDSASGTVGAGGGSVSTGSIASALDPIESTVTVPSGFPGAVTVSEGDVTTVTPSGYALFGQQVDVTAPAANAASPLRLDFVVDSSVVPPGQDESTVQVFRNGQAAGDCPASLSANPDPCVMLRERLADGDLHLTVLSSDASTWTLGAHEAFSTQGFEQPVDNLPTLNTVSAGRAIPVKFVVYGSNGNAIGSRYPRSATVACGSNAPVDAIEETVTAGDSSLSYNAATSRYTYIWKTEKTWAGSCRQLAVKLIDGTTLRAAFKLN